MNAIEDVIKWYKLGVQLDFKKGRLDIIKADHPNDVEGAKMELVSEWLNNDPDKSWDKLASALRQIGHINLSDKISAYGRGMLFSIVLSCSNVCSRKYIIMNLLTACYVLLASEGSKRATFRSVQSRIMIYNVYSTYVAVASGADRHLLFADS